MPNFHTKISPARKRWRVESSVPNRKMHPANAPHDTHIPIIIPKRKKNLPSKTTREDGQTIHYCKDTSSHLDITKLVRGGPTEGLKRESLKYLQLSRSTFMVFGIKNLSQVPDPMTSEVFLPQ